MRNGKKAYIIDTICALFSLTNSLAIKYIKTTIEDDIIQFTIFKKNKLLHIFNNKAS